MKETQSSPRKLSNVLKRALPVAARENIYTIPNLLTASRLIAAPFIGYCILHDHHAWALGLFAYAGITDLLDGWIARKWNLGTVVGTVIDPMADKMLMTVLTVALAMKGGLPGELMSMSLYACDESATLKITVHLVITHLSGVSGPIAF